MVGWLQDEGQAWDVLSHLFFINSDFTSSWNKANSVQQQPWRPVPAYCACDILIVPFLDKSWNIKNLAVRECAQLQRILNFHTLEAPIVFVEAYL